MITSNDYPLDLFNGDIGVTVETDDGPKVAFGRGGIRTFPRSHTGDHVTVHAMTIHKAKHPSSMKWSWHSPLSRLDF